MQMKKKEKKRSESKTIKILNTHATVAVHICTVTVVIVHKCTIMHKLVWVFFYSNCVKLTTFSILHNYKQADVIALREPLTNPPSLSWIPFIKLLWVPEIIPNALKNFRNVVYTYFT